MQNIDPDSLPDDVKAFMQNLVSLVGDPGEARLVRTSTGYPVLIVMANSCIDSDELKITLKDQVLAKTWIALLLVYPGITELDFEHLIRELEDVSELIAVPANIAHQHLDKVCPVGEIQQRLDNSFEQVFLLLKCDRH
jgi:hypothetical protein